MYAAAKMVVSLLPAGLWQQDADAQGGEQLLQPVWEQPVPVTVKGPEPEGTSVRVRYIRTGAVSSWEDTYAVARHFWQQLDAKDVIVLQMPVQGVPATYMGLLAEKWPVEVNVVLVRHLWGRALATQPQLRQAVWDALSKHQQHPSHTHSQRCEWFYHQQGRQSTLVFYQDSNMSQFEHIGTEHLMLYVGHRPAACGPSQAFDEAKAAECLSRLQNGQGLPGGPYVCRGV